MTRIGRKALPQQILLPSVSKSPPDRPFGAVDHLVLEGARTNTPGRPGRVSGMSGHPLGLQNPKTPEGFEPLDLDRMSEREVAFWLFRRSIRFQEGRAEAAKDLNPRDGQMAMLAFMSRQDRLGKNVVAMASFLGISCEDFLKRVDCKLLSPSKDRIEKVLKEHEVVVSGIAERVASFDSVTQRRLLRTALDLTLHSKAHPLLFLTVVRQLATRLGMTSWPQIVRFCSEGRSEFETSIKNFVMLRGGTVPFDDYCHFAMFESRSGVYTGATADHLIGLSAESYMETASLHLDFAKLLLSHFRSEWEGLGRPAHFDIVEMGAGHGHLAKNIFSLLHEPSSQEGSWPEFRKALRYRIMEISPRLAAIQRENLGDHVEVIGGSVLKDPLPDVPVGLFISNELVDMFPPRKVVASPDGLREVYIALSGGLLQEVLGPLRRDTREYLDRHGITLQSSDTFYIQPAIDDWMANMDKHLGQGSILTIDYGGSREKIRSIRNEYDSPVFFGIAAPGGIYTSMRWLGEIVRFDPLVEHKDSPTGILEPKDMTLDVDMTAIGETASHLGFMDIILTTLGEFEEVRRKFDPALKSQLEIATNRGIHFTNRSFGSHAVSILRKKEFEYGKN